MQTFAEWLEDRLNERGWTAADLTAASRTEEHPRGIDSGLISRWRRKDALAVVPTQAKTLGRLAHALEIPEIDVYRAAGLVPADATEESSLPPQVASLPPQVAAFMAQVERAYHALTEQEWQVRKDAGLALFSVGHPVKAHPSTTDRPRRGRPNTHSNGVEPGEDNPLARCYNLNGPTLTAAVSAM